MHEPPGNFSRTGMLDKRNNSVSLISSLFFVNKNPVRVGLTTELYLSESVFGAVA